MSKVSVKSYVIPNVNYDVLLMDTDKKEFEAEATVRLSIAKDNNADNKMQIDFKNYTDKDTPFVVISIIGVFEIPNDIIKEDQEYIAKILAKDGFELLYEKLKESFSAILKATNVNLPPMPNITK